MPDLPDDEKWKVKWIDPETVPINPVPQVTDPPIGPPLVIRLPVTLTEPVTE